MNTCPKCGAQFQSTVKICPNDGTVLEEAARSDPRIGTTLDGKYRLESALGQGGMGTIYRATHLMLDKPVALKLIKGDLVTSPEVVRRFQREARAASNLNHPNIAAAYDLGQTSDGTLYIAMELVNGPSLKDVIRSTGPLQPARIGRILRQVAGALAVAHKHGIIHRDLKPHNIMLATQPGGGEVAKLLDFGIAKTFDESATQLTATGFVLGTPQYMSPEQAAGRPIDGRSDLYSLGIIMFEMLVGDVPFNDPSTPAVLVKHLTEPAPTPSRRRPDLAISPALEAVALRCLEKDPAARFQSADEFIVALDGALGLTGTATAVEQAAAPTVIMSPPSAPTATAPAAAAASAAPTATSPLAATVLVPPTPSGPTQKTAPVITPVVPPSTIPATAAAPAAPAASIPPTAPSPVAAPPPAPIVAAPPPPVAPPPPLSAVPSAASSASSAQSSSSPLGRNFIVVGAVLLLLIGVGAYAAYATGWLGGRSSAPPATAPLTAANTTEPAPQTPPSTPESQPAAPSLPPAGSGAGSGAESTSSAGGAGRLATGGAGTKTSPRGAVPSKPRPESTAAQAPAGPVQPVNPSVAFRCSGPGPVCASLRSAMGPALEGQSIVSVSDPAKADILIEARVEQVDERTEQMFGTTFVTRTYSVELSGETRQSSQAVPMPGATTFSYDARVGQEKLDGQTRLIAASAAEKVRSFWKPKF